MLAGHVLGHSLEHQCLDIAQKQIVQHRRGVGFVEIVPGELAAIVLQMLRRERQQLLNHRLLAHRIDEPRVSEIDRVNFARRVGIKLNLNRSDQALQMRRIAQPNHRGHHLGAHPVHEPQALGTDGRQLKLGTLRFERAHLQKRRPQHVGVHAPAKALVGRNHNQTHRPRFVTMREKRVPILRIGRGKARRDRTNLLRIGACSAHPLLRPPHLRGGDHLHRLGDLSRILNALDLGPDLFATRHDQYEPVFLNA